MSLQKYKKDVPKVDTPPGDLTLFLQNKEVLL
jgi:hypothetical protein